MTAVQIRAINFTVVTDDDRWGKKKIAEAVGKDNELSKFGEWVRDGL